jgi:phage FluMu protein Com
LLCQPTLFEFDMPIEFDCACGKHLKVPEIHAGKRAKCPACKEVVTVPALEAAPTEPEQGDEDAAFRALTEGPEPEARDWRTNSAPSYSPPPPQRPQQNEDDVRRKAAEYAARMAASEAPAKKPDTKKKKSKQHDEYAPRERRWNINWGTMMWALAALFGGLIWLGLGYLAGRIYFYPFFLIAAGIFGIIKSLLNSD